MFNERLVDWKCMVVFDERLVYCLVRGWCIVCALVVLGGWCMCICIDNV